MKPLHSTGDMNDVTSLRERIVKTLNYLPQGIATEALADKLEAIVAQEVLRVEEQIIKYIRKGNVAGSFSEGCDCEKCNKYENVVRADFKALTRTPPVINTATERKIEDEKMHL